MKDILDSEGIRVAAFKCRRLGMYAAYEHLIWVWASMKWGKDWTIKDMNIPCTTDPDLRMANFSILTMEAQEDGFYD